MTAEQRFLNLQLKELEVSPRWKELFLKLLPHRRMIILYPLQKQQVENISNIDSDEVFLLANDYKNPSIIITLSFLDKLSIKTLSKIEETA